VDSKVVCLSLLSSATSLTSYAMRNDVTGTTTMARLRYRLVVGFRCLLFLVSQEPPPKGEVRVGAAGTRPRRGITGRAENVEIERAGKVEQKTEMEWISWLDGIATFLFWIEFCRLVIDWRRLSYVFVNLVVW
jgi:hypothetical protein